MCSPERWINATAWNGRLPGGATGRRYPGRHPSGSVGAFDAAPGGGGAWPGGMGDRIPVTGGEASTPAARRGLVLHLFAALADFERGLIAERTKASLDAKRRRGERIGRPRALTPAQVREARTMIARGESVSHTARIMRCGRATLYRALSSVDQIESTWVTCYDPGRGTVGKIASEI